MKRVQTFKEVLAQVEAARRAGKTIVATNGCFDILHVGHVRNLEEAKALGDVLVVGVNSDASVRLNKDASRPIIKERERAEMLAALKPVDHVFIFSGRTPLTWIQKLRPDIHVKGGGKDIHTHPDLPAHRKAVEQAGGTLVLLTHHDGRSTSHIIRKIRGESKPK